MASKTTTTATGRAPKILVTGAAGGNQGATGRVLTHLLLDRGVHVRAMVRTDDDRAAQRRTAGAEVIVGDLLSYDDMRQAVKGMDYMYFAFAVQGGLLEGSTVAAVVAAEAGLKGIVENSQWCADLQSRSPQSSRHALAEAIFDAFPTPAVHLRGATYNINMIAQLLPAAMKASVLRAPSMAATDLLPLVSGTDVAAAADAVLKDFGAYAGQAILMTSQLRSLETIASAISAAVGKKVTFQSISAETWEEDITRNLPSFNSTGVEHLKALWEIMREGSHNQELMAQLKASQPRLQQIIGKKPRTFEDDLSAFLSAKGLK